MPDTSPRYLALTRPPAAEWVWSEGITPQPIVVHEADARPQETGLLDQHGTKIYRVPRRHPIGFCPPGQGGEHADPR